MPCRVSLEASTLVGVPPEQIQLDGGVRVLLRPLCHRLESFSLALQAIFDRDERLVDAHMRPRVRLCSPIAILLVPLDVDRASVVYKTSQIANSVVSLSIDKIKECHHRVLSPTGPPHTSTMCLSCGVISTARSEPRSLSDSLLSSSWTCPIKRNAHCVVLQVPYWSSTPEIEETHLHHHFRFARGSSLG
jgi:hypothetical protein